MEFVRQLDYSAQVVQEKDDIGHGFVEYNHVLQKNTIVTTNGYTEKEDLEAGDVIVSCLGDPDGEKAELRKGDIKDFDGVVHVKQLIELFG